jgi:hypothetical protein
MIKPSQAAIERELTKRKAQDGEAKIQFILEDFLFDKQLEFVRDKSPFKTAVCSRRAGKTTSCAGDLIETAINNHGVVCLYITLSRTSAKRIIWKELQTINRVYKLGGKLDNTELSITFPNGSIIYLSGAKDSSEIEKFRGLALKLVYIDECQSFRSHIQELIDDVLAPALLDYDGTLSLIGTPGPVPAGFFYDASVTSDSWSHHHWTFFDNKWIEIKSKKTHKEQLDRELKRRGVGGDDPSIQREFYGKWVQDSDSLLIHYSAPLNDFTTLPHLLNGKYEYIMGVDIGFNDADAIAVLAWSDHSPYTYLIEEDIKPKQDITSLCEQIERLRKKYDVSNIVMDAGALGKKIHEEIVKRFLIPVKIADKARKMENIALFNDALRRGHFKAHKNSMFVNDSYLVEIDREKSTPDRTVVSTGYHSDIIDAALYAFKLSPAYSYSPPPSKPKYGTKEWADQETSEMWSSAQDHFQEQADILKQGEKLGYGDDY